MTDRIDLRPYRARGNGAFRLARHAPDFLPKHADRDHAERALASSIEMLRALQEKLYAHHRWSLLVILQAMDAAGKDSTIKHVMSGVNPQSCEVHSFKAPSDEELDHDYLWRTSIRLPGRGHVGIFNRSYYEEVLVARVHPELLEAEKLPASFVTKRIWKERYDDLVAHERHLARNGTVIRKIFLNVSKNEQRRRLLARLDEPAKRWKFSVHDLEERARWKDYMRAYDEAIRHTTTDAAPWYVVPADRKWWTHAVVAAILVDALDSLDLKPPAISGAKKGELQQVREALERA